MRECFIFLDVDGPLNTTKNIKYHHRNNLSTSSYKIGLPRRNLERLATIVNQTGAKLILSSSWRLVNIAHAKNNVSPARINLEKQLRKVGLSLSGQTPHIMSKRGLEINAWLNRFEENNGYRPAYVILDDKLNNLLDDHRGHIVYCDPATGITDKEMDIAIRLLYRQMDTPDPESK